MRYHLKGSQNSQQKDVNKKLKTYDLTLLKTKICYKIFGNEETID